MTDRPPRSLTAQGRRTRTVLLAAARRVFAERGYVEARINDITDAAEVSVGTFYTYFESKDEVFGSVVGEAFAQLLAAVREGTDPAEACGTPLDRVRAINRRYLVAFEADARLWAAIEEAALATPALRPIVWEARGACVAALTQVLRRWRDEGSLETRVVPEIAALGLSAMSEQCAYQWLVFERSPGLEAGVDRLSGMWARILGVRDRAR